MSKLIEFFLGSILITLLTIALMLFSALHYILRAGGIADCVWHSSARAWVDSNGDGFVNNGEQPLRDVEIHMDAENQLAGEGGVGWSAITDQDGQVQLNVSIPGCSETVFEVYADIPEGYRLTTRPRLEVTGNFWESLRAESIYYFGFRADR
jgi:hypothetical protein